MMRIPIFQQIDELHHATETLVQTNCTLSQIASRLAFTDTSNFIKFFKRLTGQGPTEYRRSRNFLL